MASACLSMLETVLDDFSRIRRCSRMRTLALVTVLRTRGARQAISPKHDVYAPRGKLRKCSQHSDLQNFPHRQAKLACTNVTFDLYLHFGGTS